VVPGAFDPKGRNLMAAAGPSVRDPVPGEPKYCRLFTTELRPEEAEIG
jgi:hypothetical protein